MIQSDNRLAGWRPRGLVFDLDGTVCDNMPLHADAFAIFCERHRLGPFSADLRARLDGKRNRDIFPVLFGRALEPEELARYSGEKEGLYRELSGGRLAPLPGLLRLLDAAEGAGLPVAVATSAPADNVRHSLAQMGLAQRLPHVVRGDEVPHGKPHPDVFLAAARLIGRDPAECLAFEDAPLGLVAAHAAGMRCVAVTTSFTAEALAAAGAPADIAVPDFQAFLDYHGELVGFSPGRG